jgi:hypothetical protein
MQSTNTATPAHFASSGIFPTVYYQLPSNPPTVDQLSSPFQYMYPIPYLIAAMPPQQSEQMPGSAFNLLQKVPAPRGSDNQRPPSQATSLQVIPPIYENSKTISNFPFLFSLIPGK